MKTNGQKIDENKIQIEVQSRLTQQIPIFAHELSKKYKIDESVKEFLIDFAHSYVTHCRVYKNIFES